MTTLVSNITGLAGRHHVYAEVSFLKTGLFRASQLHHVNTESHTTVVNIQE